jgi:hypothetical protein
MPAALEAVQGPDVPVEALSVTPRIESFCWRIEQLVGEGGSALIIGKSVTLRILTDRLARQRSTSRPSPASTTVRRIWLSRRAQAKRRS